MVVGEDDRDENDDDNYEDRFLQPGWDGQDKGMEARASVMRDEGSSSSGKSLKEKLAGDAALESGFGLGRVVHY